MPSSTTGPGQPAAPEQVVRAMFDAYRRQDRESGEALLGEDLSFTSPQDDHIDRVAYLERCFPTADRFSRQELLEVVPLNERDVFSFYEYDLEAGGTYRNTEVTTVEDGWIIEIQVFFGGAVR